MSVRRGYRLSRAKGFGLVDHVGLTFDGRDVFHNLPGKGEHLSSMVDFAAGQAIRAQEVLLDWAEAFAVSSNIADAVSKNRPYHWSENNCEHSVSRVLGKQPQSPQLQFWGTALFVASIIGLAALAARRG